MLIVLDFPVLLSKQAHHREVKVDVGICVTISECMHITTVTAAEKLS